MERAWGHGIILCSVNVLEDTGLVRQSIVALVLRTIHDNVTSNESLTRERTTVTQGCR